MIILMAKRQSRGSGTVRVSEHQQPDVAEYVAARIRAAMERRGWVENGKPDVSRLQEAVRKAGKLDKGPRWQTVQYWITGESPPSTQYATLIARALGMTLEELMGAATGEPIYPEWPEFLETPEGKSMTQTERQALASMLWPHGAPDVASYKMMLMIVRMRRAS